MHLSIDRGGIRDELEVLARHMRDPRVDRTNLTILVRYMLHKATISSRNSGSQTCGEKFSVLCVYGLRVFLRARNAVACDPRRLCSPAVDERQNIIAMLIVRTLMYRGRPFAPCGMRRTCLVMQTPWLRVMAWRASGRLCSTGGASRTIPSTSVPQDGMGCSSHNLSSAEGMASSYGLAGLLASCALQTALRAMKVAESLQTAWFAAR